jgi:TPR repeat protein
MKTLLLCCLWFLAMSATAQLTANQRIGAFAGYGLGPIIQTPPTPLEPANNEPAWRKVGTNIVDVASFQRFDCRAETTSGGLALAVIQNPSGWRRVAIRNFQGEVTSGKTLYIRALRNGIYQDGSEPLELWDCGVPLSKEEMNEKQAAEFREYQRMKQERQIAAEKAAEIRAEKKKAADAAALKANLAAAEKGDAYGLLRMGERYRDGNGVEKDLGKAREYLQKAADAGSPTAKEELSKLEAK